MKSFSALVLILAFSQTTAFVPVVGRRTPLTTVTPSSTIVVVRAPPLAVTAEKEKVQDSTSEKATSSATDAKVTDKEDDEKLNLMSKIKAAGAAGAVSLFLWELAFWAISIPVAIFGFVQVSGSFPDFSNNEDIAKVGAEAFAFANVARLALPVRIGLAVASIPWVEENIIEAPWAARFFKKEVEEES